MINIILRYKNTRGGGSRAERCLHKLFKEKNIEYEFWQLSSFLRANGECPFLIQGVYSIRNLLVSWFAVLRRTDCVLMPRGELVIHDDSWKSKFKILFVKLYPVSKMKVIFSSLSELRLAQDFTSGLKQRFVIREPLHFYFQHRFGPDLLNAYTPSNLYCHRVSLLHVTDGSTIKNTSYILLNLDVLALRYKELILINTGRRKLDESLIIKIRKKCFSLGINFRLEGAVGDEELCAMYKRCDVIQPSLSESTGLVSAECFVFGGSVIVTKFSVFSELKQHPAILLVDPKQSLCEDELRKLGPRIDTDKQDRVEFMKTYFQSDILTDFFKSLL